MRSCAIWISVLLTALACEADACSGPGAAAAMRRSAVIGLSFGGVSLAIIGAGCVLDGLRSQGRRRPALLALVALQPALWMGTASGDCGYGLRIWSMIFALLTADLVALIILWPGSIADGWRWPLSGGLGGAAVAILAGAVFVQASFGLSMQECLLAAAMVGSIVAIGCLAGGWLLRIRTEPRSAFRFSLKTLLILPIVIAPLLVVLLPVMPYEYSVSVSRPFSFVALDAKTGRPIEGATIRLIDPRYPQDDEDNQGQKVVSGPDGSAPYFVHAHEYGRAGLLGRTETTTYNPWLIRAEAEGYQPFYTSLEDTPPIPADQLTARPLGMTFPPPPSAAIRMVPRISDPSRTIPSARP